MPSYCSKSARSARRSPQRLHWVRVAALLCAGLFLAASARGFLPSLCVNTGAALAAVDTSDGSTLGPQRACCSLKDGANSGGEAPRDPAQERRCALCSLAKTPFEPLEQVRLPLPALAALPPFLASVSNAPDGPGFAPAIPRAPPAFLPAA